MSKLRCPTCGSVLVLGHYWTHSILYGIGNRSKEETHRAMQYQCVKCREKKPDSKDVDTCFLEFQDGSVWVFKGGGDLRWQQIRDRLNIMY